MLGEMVECFLLFILVFTWRPGVIEFLLLIDRVIYLILQERGIICFFFHKSNLLLPEADKTDRPEFSDRDDILGV